MDETLSLSLLVCVSVSRIVPKRSLGDSFGSNGLVTNDTSPIRCSHSPACLCRRIADEGVTGCSS